MAWTRTSRGHRAAFVTVLAVVIALAAGLGISLSLASGSSRAGGPKGATFLGRLLSSVRKPYSPGEVLPVQPQTIALAITPDAQHLFAVPIYGVTIREVNAASGQIERYIRAPTFCFGMAIDPSGRTAFVTSSSASSVSPIDLATGALEDGRAIHLQSMPFGIAITPSGHELWVTEPEADAVVVLDRDTARIERSIKLSSSPFGIAITPSGHELWVTEPEADAVVVLDRDTARIERSIKLSSSPFGIAITPSGHELWVTEPFSNEVLVLSARNGHTLKVLTGFSEPSGVAISPSAGTAFVANFASDTVARFGSATDPLIPVPFSLLPPGYANRPLTFFSTIAWDPPLVLASDLEAFLIDGSGRIYRTSDGGRTWAVAYSSTQVTVKGLDFVDPKDGWATLDYELTPSGAVVARGTSSTALQLLRTTDGGSTWQEVQVRSPAFLGFVAFVSPTNGWGLDVKGEVVQTTDGGSSWTKVAQPAEPVIALCVSQGILWAAYYDAIYKAEAAELRWSTSYSNPSASRVDPESGIVLNCAGTMAEAEFAFPPGAGQYPAMYVATRDAGSSWEVLPLTWPGFYEGPVAHIVDLTPATQPAFSPPVNLRVVSPSSLGYVASCNLACPPGLPLYVTFTKIDLAAMTLETSVVVEDKQVVGTGSAEEAFLGDGRGMMLVGVRSAEPFRDEVFTTDDGGKTWQLAGTL
jgi:YVTN family beta-propeller protein